MPNSPGSKIRSRHPAVHRMYGVRRIDLSSAQLASSESIRDNNRDIVLELIRFRQPIARASLARLSGLQPSTISVIVEQLIEEGWVREGAVVKLPRGRPSRMLSVNDRMVTLALDLRPDRAVLAVVDLSGRFLASETVMTYADPERTVAVIVRQMKLLREQHADKIFEGIGGSIPGRVDPVTQRLLLAPNLDWRDFDLKGALEKAMDLQVELDNVANACLLSESWFGTLAGKRDVVLVAVAEGIGGAIMAGGELYSGHSGLAGEFGHISVDPNGLLCGCGQHGCWETVASSRAAMRNYLALSPESTLRDVYDLFRMAEEGDRKAVKALSMQASALGRGLRIITAALSPELILISGDITAAWDKWGPVVERELRESMLPGTVPELRISGDAGLARLSGSAAMLMHRHAGYHKSTHVGRPARATHSPAKIPGEHLRANLA
jgi:predicted NBD/HSP70 family sugar kinase